MESGDLHKDEDKQKQKDEEKYKEVAEEIETSTNETQETVDSNTSSTNVEEEAAKFSGSYGTKIKQTMATTSGLLQKCEQETKNNEASHDNDLKAFSYMQRMRFPNSFKSSSQKATTISHNGHHVASALPLDLQAYTRKQLESLVVSLHYIFYELTMNDVSLRSKVQQLAINMNYLQNFPLFMANDDNVPSTSQRSRTQSIGDQVRIQEGTISSSTSKNSSQKSNVEQKKSESRSSPQGRLLKYINSILSEYLGEQQQDKFEKLKCSTANLEDLEAYAQTLVQAGLGHILEAEIRVNRKNNKQAFVTLNNDRESLDGDAMVTLPVARCYAFNGDIVRAFIMQPKAISQNISDEGGKKTRRTSSNIMDSKDNSICLADEEELFFECNSSPDTDMEDHLEAADANATVTDNCRKAFVISIVKQTELREVVGSISFKKTSLLKNRIYYKLKPHDMRVPMLYIAADSCQDHVKLVSKENVVGMLYLARVLETDSNGYCLGELLQPVGSVGNLEAEIKAILLHNGMKNLKPYEEKFCNMYDCSMPPVTAEDLRHREDLRKLCIFTIDPLTARDLDDAVSIEKLSDEDYEIGVHISDVSYYLEENSELDNLVKERATSIYLVNEVIHMLPKSLCMRCSLLPGEDKFAFSVFWRWNEITRRLGHPRFTRSVINSCSQFAYEHAQMIIDNKKEVFGREDFPEIYNNFTPDDIKWRVLLLHSISQTLKAQRYESGALSINNPKLRFSLHPETGEPITYEIEERQEANFLIEELMLLANQAVAKFIHQHFPDTSILRNHPPPLQKSIKALKERLAALNLDFDISTSKAIYESMQRLCNQASDPIAMDACLSTMLTKPMARARYYCSEGKSEQSEFWHFALSIPIYTHFTSPIRRYPDILVHRSLAAALNYCKPTQRTADELHELAKICNEQKNNAKNAGDESIDLFFVRYIRAKESITLKAVVTDVYRHMMNVVTIETGHAYSIPYKLQKVGIDATHVPSYILVSEKNSPNPPLKLQLFSTVDIKVVLRDNKTCAFIESPDKTQRRLNSKESSKIREQKPFNNASSNTANGCRHNNSISEYEERSEMPDNKPRRKRRGKRKDRKHAVKADDQ